MSSVEVRDPQGTVLGERALPAELFEAGVNVPVMHQVVVAGMAVQRAGTHSTKTRGEVAGGGRKPWRQKGTGRARHGSIRSPLWAGGGVAHGPKPRDYAKRINKKMKRAALRSALSDAAQTGKLAVVQDLAFEEPKTRDATAVLDALGLSGRVLLVIDAPDEAVEKSFRNIGHVKVDYPGNLSTYDLLFADRVLFTSQALDALTGETTEPFARVEEAVEAEEEPDRPGSPESEQAEQEQQDQPSPPQEEDPEAVALDAEDEERPDEAVGDTEVEP
jgi:large subunit ribosomal protein L4